jgi:hypothetical protein
MPVLKNSEMEALALPGITHQTVAGHKQGVNSMEVWVQTIAPGGSKRVCP